MVAEMENIGLRVEASHHEVGGPGQCEIDFRFGELVDIADQVSFDLFIYT